MKRIYIYAITAFALLAGACSDNELNDDAPVIPATPDIVIPEGAAEGELLIKFVPEMTEILDRTMKTRAAGASTRSGIPSTDEVLSILGAYDFERVFLLIRALKKRAVRRDYIFGIWYVLIKIRI